MLAATALSAALRGLLAVQRSRVPCVRAAARLTVLPEEAERLPALLALRDRLKQTPQLIAMEDHGAGARPHALRDDSAGVKLDRRTVADIYRRAASTHPWAWFLFKLVRAQRPERVLELGTNLGVAAAYLNAALDLNGTGYLTTIEGDPTLAELAREHIAATSDHPADVIQGRFQDVLPGLLPRLAPLDLVFLDGHHEDQPTRAYFTQIAWHLDPSATVVFDDVEPWREVYRAYRAICRANPHAQAIHLGKIALLKGTGAGWHAPVAG